MIDTEWYLIEPENNCDCKNCIADYEDCLYVEVDGKWVIVDERGEEE
tara:strand:+ start:528 stop:668 length:141 start_codon:yes stop_codon:yes gene_type:complete